MVLALHRVTVRPEPAKKGDWRGELGELPTPEVSRPITTWMAPVQLEGVPLPPGTRLQCANYYPPGGGIGWHTDFAYPGWRVYVHTSDAPGTVFRYGNDTILEGTVGGYVFETGPACWHALVSAGHRLACGLQIPPALANELVAATR